ncbi:MAG: exodeoxyribonuclease VII small subunit [Clostridia bacterium]|nr:exodeoxyribonuclease VII small subunit [Clostridia bacterium]
MTKKQQSFEERLEELESIVRKMEGGSLPLNETLAAYEAGMQLSKALSEELSAAEARMLELSGGQVKPMEDAP